MMTSSIPFFLEGAEIPQIPPFQTNPEELQQQLSQQSDTLGRMLSYLKAMPSSPGAISDAVEGLFETILVGNDEGDFVLDVGPSHIFARHKLFQYPGPGAPYAGDIRTGLVVNGAGIIMGYNSKTTGAFVPAVAISATGDVAITGTLTAGSVIATTARFGSISGTLAGTVVAQAAAGNSHASSINTNPHNTSLIQIAGDLDDISDGSSFFKTTLNQRIGAGRAFNSLDSSSEYIYSISTQKIIVSGSNPANGIVIDDNGLRGYASSTLKFNINTAGTLWFAGDISGATGTFSSNISTGGQVTATGSTGSSAGNYSIVGAPTSGAVGGLAGIAGNSAGSVGVRGYALNGQGVNGDSGNISYAGIAAGHQAGGYGLLVSGARGINRVKNLTGKLRVWDTATNTLQGEYWYEFGI